ncbi:hypothetical protein [Escherichia coli]|uniref:hypothetical protein n=1 Tax=Escherichia coli TaxID=562 RepID=UPI003CCA526C
MRALTPVLRGIGELITFEVKDVAQLTNPLPKGPYGTVLSNPPYGERLERTGADCAA